MKQHRLAYVLALMACVPDSSRRGPGQAEEAAQRPVLDLSREVPWPGTYAIPIATKMAITRRVPQTRDAGGRYVSAATLDT